MPTYDYYCSACKHTFERFESIGVSGPKPCLKCGKKKAKRRLGTGAGLIFKGSGFYVTDYKGNSGAKEPAKKPAETPKEASKEAPKETPKKEGKESKK